ncbi:MAG: hypothetical protein QY309_05820 [Cyclobacteriaceae bacterium]|nr:MAG: hypothetical protein QY309_05820 [Cyclobacteriaceae bacterium]
MKATDANSILVQSYLGILERLNPESQLDLISKLSEKLKKGGQREKNTFQKAFGAWDTRDSAEELIRTIRKSRKLNRKIEGL